MDVTKIALRQENGRLVVSYQPAGGQWRACLSLLPETLGDGSHVVELSDKAPADELPKSMIVQPIASKPPPPSPAVANALVQSGFGEEISRIAAAVAKDGDAQLHKRIDEVLDQVQAKLSRTLDHVRHDIETSGDVDDQRFDIMKGRTELLRKWLYVLAPIPERDTSLHAFDDTQYIRDHGLKEAAEGDGVSGG